MVGVGTRQGIKTFRGENTVASRIRASEIEWVLTMKRFQETKTAIQVTLFFLFFIDAGETLWLYETP